MLILEHLDFPELLNMAQTSKYFASLANDVFRREFAKRTVIIEATQPGQGIGVIEDEEATMIHDNITVSFEMASALLKLFGQSIRNLKISCGRIDLHHESELMFNINEYCAETLGDVSVTGCSESLFTDIRKPFAKVENVSLFGGIDISDKIKLNETFPNLRQLSLKFTTITHPNCFHLEFSQLIEISIDFSQSDFMYSSAFQRLFELNPQIRRILIQHGSHNFLTIVNQYLPNLEVLHIKRIFRNYFTTKHWTDDMTKNEHLIDLHFSEDVFEYEFSKLAEAFPHLETVTVGCPATDVSQGKIIEFIKRLKRLNKLSLIAFNERLEFSLKMALEKEWTVHSVHVTQQPIVINIESKLA